MKILHLTLKKKWFDMILSGEKTEEYRSLKDYWVNRLMNKPTMKWMQNGMQMESRTRKEYDMIRFTNGYGKHRPAFDIELLDIDVGMGNVEWGAEEGETYHILRLGKIISIQGLK